MSTKLFGTASTSSWLASCVTAVASRPSARLRFALSFPFGSLAMRFWHESKQAWSSADCSLSKVTQAEPNPVTGALGMRMHFAFSSSSVVWAISLRLSCTAASSSKSFSSSSTLSFYALAKRVVPLEFPSLAPRGKVTFRANIWVFKLLGRVFRKCCNCIFTVGKFGILGSSVFVLIEIEIAVRSCLPEIRSSPALCRGGGLDSLCHICGGVPFQVPASGGFRLCGALVTLPACHLVALATLRTNPFVWCGCCPQNGVCRACSFCLFLWLELREPLRLRRPFLQRLRPVLSLSKGLCMATPSRNPDFYRASMVSGKPPF